MVKYYKTWHALPRYQSETQQCKAFQCETDLLQTRRILGHYLQCFIPAACHYTGVVGGFYPVDCFNWCFVLQDSPKITIRKKSISAIIYSYSIFPLHNKLTALASFKRKKLFHYLNSRWGKTHLCNLNGLITLKVPHLGCFVTRGCEHFGPILLKES